MGALMTEREYRSIVNRQRRLPEQIGAARKRLANLEAEAVRLGMTELLEVPAHG